MPSVATGTTSTGSYEAYNPDRVSDLPRVDATTDSPGHTPQGFGNFGQGQIRDSDADVAGMLALQQGKAFPTQRHDTYMSESSKYSTDE